MTADAPPNDGDPAESPPNDGERAESLTRRLRVKTRALERTQEALLRLEEYKDKNDLLLRRVIAEMREAQSALEKRNAELRRIQEQLLVSERRALAASEAKSVFLANMSHEIRTPLNGILGVAELLRDVAETPAQHDLVRVIQRSGKVLLGTINNVLDLSKIEAGKSEVHAEDFDLCDLLQEVCELFAPNAEDKGLQLVLACPATVPRVVEGDPRGLRRVLNNLVNNAIKFTAEGEVVLWVLPEPCSGDRARVRFEIRDTGIGIAEANLEAIFEAFAQVDTSSTRTHDGTGLGLAISRQLLDLLGAELSVSSEVGVGSTFSFTLEFPVKARATPRQREGAVLLAEQNATVREITRECLLFVGYQVVDLADEQVPPGEWTAAVFDWDLPHSEALAQSLRNAGIPSVLRIPWSASGLKAPRERSTVQVRRPASTRVLLHAIDAALAKSAPAGAARILVAEDNEINRRVMVGLLERSGYSCELVSTGLQAVEACASTQFDLVFMDCRMPEMDGLEATRAIRERETRRAPILALTAGTGVDERRRCLDAGMDDFLVKPIDVSALQRVLKRYLG